MAHECRIWWCSPYTEPLFHSDVSPGSSSLNNRYDPTKPLLAAPTINVPGNTNLSWIENISSCEYFKPLAVCNAWKRATWDAYSFARVIDTFRYWSFLRQKIKLSLRTKPFRLQWRAIMGWWLFRILKRKWKPALNKCYEMRSVIYRPWTSVWISLYVFYYVPRSVLPTEYRYREYAATNTVAWEYFLKQLCTLAAKRNYQA